VTGRGFNPLLQDIGLTIHPPILYLGYAGLSIPATISISVLLQRKITIDNNLISKFYIWIALPWALLSCGISLGSWWAYRELGWGGFWFWDPVENVSLIVWIASTISLHLLKLSQNSNSLYRSLFISNVSAFILSFFGMLLVRSGMLVSVHSFAFDPEKGQVMLAILSFIVISSMVIFYTRWNNINSGKPLKLSNITTSSLLANIALLFCACVVIILGIMYPIFQDFLYNKSVSVDEKFYIKTLSIFFLPIIYIAGVYSANQKKYILSLILLSALVVTIINYVSDISSYLNAAYIHASIFLILSLLKNCTNLSKISMTVGHLGFAVLIIGGSLHYTYQFNEIISAQKNRTVQIKNYNITLKNIEYKKIDNYLSRKALVEIANEKKILGTLSPEIRFYPIEKTFTIESAILHTIKGDIYLTLGELDKEKILIELQFKPFIYLLWTGSALMVISIMLYFLFRNGHTKIQSKA
jgi:cytochrome c-type biogenesis protein CcmF